MTRTPCQDDPELWLADTAELRHEAMRLCRPCPMIAECLAGAIANREKFGVWGGRDFSHATTRPKLPPAPPAPIKHGTPAGYALHQRRGVPICDACREAHSAARALRRARQEAAA